ncbi:segregation and condensation protein A [Limnoglobus roseus]|uniref:Segregation and condensation protein A n=1 Tax=Limnoglobus roseus TaxID=2598579 RepID=A0A5C1A5N9_9BACT|nr:segregation/condensation protein A [Limnoglobus roseus]QEL13655.1 chromosome segregation protein ScpA [Limnoglobus roseus]
MSYQVSLQTFHGPLDLLLYLVRRNEVDVHDIPIATIADEFLEYIRVVQQLDVELVGDFLVMAATLMEIKVRGLLPSEVAAEAGEAPDPRRQLVKQLLEYRKYKDAAAALEQRAESHNTRLPRVAPLEPAAVGGAPPVRPVELWDLVSAFARLMRETQGLQPKTITIDDTPQEVYERRVVEQVRAAGRINFRDVFTPPYSKSKLIGLFLAILELIKHHEIELEQLEPFGEIWLLAVKPAQTAAVPPTGTP